MKIIWSEEAQLDYEQNIDYLLENWTSKEALVFIEQVESVLNTIVEHPKAYPKSKSKSIRQALIRKQIKLYYKIEEDHIYLIRFWNTYQNPESLKL